MNKNKLKWIFVGFTLLILSGNGLFSKEEVQKKYSLSSHWTQEKTDKGLVLTVFIKNTGTEDIVNVEMKLILKAKNLDDTEPQSGKVVLSLSCGQEVTLPIVLAPSTTAGEFFGISIPTEKTIEELKEVDIDCGETHFICTQDIKSSVKFEK
jgi:hypothetical protein